MPAAVKQILHLRDEKCKSKKMKLPAGEYIKKRNESQVIFRKIIIKSIKKVASKMSQKVK